MDQSWPFIWVTTVGIWKATLRFKTSISNQTVEISHNHTITWVEIVHDSLFTRSRGAILTLWWRSNSHNLTIKIHLFGFHCNPWYHQGEDLTVTPNFKTLSILSLQWKIYSWIMLTDRTFWKSQSLNLLFSSSSRLIFASKECLKSRFHQKNRENSLLELWISISKTWNEIPLIRRSNKSFQAQFCVKLCVFLLTFFHLPLDFNFEA